MRELDGAVLARLRDLLLQGQECVEGKLLSRLSGLFARVRSCNVKGRFLERQDFLARLRELEPRVDRPSLQLVRVEALEMDESTALATYLIDFSWVDVEAWEETHTSALVTLELRRRALGWVLEGFTFAELPRGYAGEPSTDWIREMGGTGDAGMEFYSFTRYPT
jgi:hypothetical protein